LATSAASPIGAYGHTTALCRIQSIEEKRVDGAPRYNIFIKLLPARTKGLPVKSVRPENNFTYSSVAAYAVDHLREKLKAVVVKQVGLVLHGNTLPGRAVLHGLSICNNVLLQHPSETRCIGLQLCCSSAP
jgi:hypothetical protein